MPRTGALNMQVLTLADSLADLGADVTELVCRCFKTLQDVEIHMATSNYCFLFKINGLLPLRNRILKFCLIYQEIPYCCLWLKKSASGHRIFNFIFYFLVNFKILCMLFSESKNEVEYLWIWFSSWCEKRHESSIKFKSELHLSTKYVWSYILLHFAGES